MTHIQRSITSVSWIPSDVMGGIGGLGMTFHMSHVDQPPPDSLGADIDAAIEELRANDRLRFANVLRAHAEFDGDRAVSHGYDGGGVIGATTVNAGVGSITVAAVMLPAIQLEPEVGDGWVRFTQTVGGRTGVPLPRPVRHAAVRPVPCADRVEHARADDPRRRFARGAHGRRLPFPRHWIYGDDGVLTGKTALADYKDWAGKAFGDRTPWGDED